MTPLTGAIPGNSRIFEYLASLYNVIWIAYTTLEHVKFTIEFRTC